MNNFQNQNLVRFKTQLCRHFEANGNCSRGETCHFAHGQEELRQNDSFQQQNNVNKQYYGGQQLGGQQNFKTTPCKYFQNGLCKFADNCNFAHGQEDLRQAPEQSTQYNEFQVMQQQQQMQMNFLNALQMMRFQQQLSVCIEQLSEVKNQDIQAIAKQAKLYLNQGNIQECGQCIQTAFTLNVTDSQDLIIIQQLQEGLQNSNQQANMIPPNMEEMALLMQQQQNQFRQQQ